MKKDTIFEKFLMFIMCSVTGAIGGVVLVALYKLALWILHL